MKKATITAICLGAFSTTYSFGAAAQDEVAARVLFEHGIEALERGDYLVCAGNMDGSRRVIPKLITLFYLAKCEDLAGKIASADAHFEQFLAGVRALSPDKQAKQKELTDEAEKVREKLHDEIPTLTLVLPAFAPPNIEVVRDGTMLTPALLGVAIPVDPGEHIVTTRVPDGPPREHRFKIERKEAKRIELQFDAPQSKPVAASVAVPPSKLPQEAKTNGMRTGGFVVLGVGLAGLVVGGVSGLVAKNDSSVVNEVCPGGTCSTYEDKTTGRDAWNRGLAAANIASVSLGISVVGVVIGAAMLIRSSTEEQRTPRQTAFVMGAQPGGFSFGLQGVLP